jgi:hypothetical protein
MTITATEAPPTPQTLRLTCPVDDLRQITDPARHAAWHQLVVDQGGPVGAVNAETLQAARGFKTVTPAAETILDVKARASGKRASGDLRRRAR